MNDNHLAESIFQFLFCFRTQLSAELQHSGLGVSPMHMKLLKRIHAIQDCTAQQIAQQLQRDKAQINRAVQDIVAKGYVYKENNPTDKRSQLLRLTEQGSTALHVMTDIETKLIEKMSQGISQQDLAHLMLITRQMRHNLST